MSDDAVRAAHAKWVTHNKNNIVSYDVLTDYSMKEFNVLFNLCVEAYRTHTLAGAGEVERWLRDGGDTDFAFPRRTEIADLIAAQREKIELYEAALKVVYTIPRGFIKDSVTYEEWIAADDLLQRARAALGREE